VVLSEATQAGLVSYEIDNLHQRAATLTDGKVSLIQLGLRVYAPARKDGCYSSSTRPSALLPDVAGMLLPSGIPALHYAVDGHTIRWVVRTKSGYQPHGKVTVNSAGRIVAGTVYSGPGSPLTASVAYPETRPKIARPRHVCRTTTPHVAARHRRLENS
jgi:hypothetical protein